MEHERLALPAPRFEKLYHLEAATGAGYEVGDTPDGRMCVVAITGGRVEGDRLRGDILPASATWNTCRAGAGGTSRADARYIIRADDGAVISVFADGFATTPIGEPAASCEGAGQDVAGRVFRERLFFTAGKRRYRWLNDVVVLAVSGMTGDGRLVGDAYMLG